MIYLYKMLVKDTRGQVKGLCSENLVGYIFTKEKWDGGEDHLFFILFIFFST